MVGIGEAYVGIGYCVDADVAGTYRKDGGYVDIHSTWHSVVVGHQRRVAHKVVDLPVVFFHLAVCAAGLYGHIACVNHCAHCEIPLVVGLAVRVEETVVHTKVVCIIVGVHRVADVAADADRPIEVFSPVG